MDAKEQMIETIMGMGVGEEFNVTDLNFKSIKFYVFVEGNSTYYSWAAKTRSGIAPEFPMHRRPRKCTHLIKYFKTLNGAKRNFIRRLSYD